MRENPYEIAQDLYDHPKVDEVEARHGRITVAHVPDNPHAQKIPEGMFNHINEVIEDTLFQWEGTDNPDPWFVCRHKITGGVHNRSIAGGNPELQVALVK